MSLEDPGWVGQETNANGAYRLAVPPGTYRLRVRPPRGPLIAHKIEGLRLSTNTTRNFVLETGLTLSGRVTGPARQPAPWAWLSIHAGDYQEVSFGQADEAGRYSLGVPVGTYHVDVYHNDFPKKTLEGVAVPHNTVLNITLDSGVLLEGKVIDDEGQPVPETQVCAHLSTGDQWFCAETEPAGSFRLRVPPAVYVVTVYPVLPLRLTRLRRLEVSGAGVTGLVLTVSRDPMPFVPDDPPKAALISISAPTAAGEVTLTGAAGAVAPHSVVVAFTLETGHFTTAQATPSGSFTATLFAPAGTSVLIKAAPDGATVRRMLSLPEGPSTFLFSNGERGGNPIVLAGLPGTILRVADPLGAGMRIGSAGRTDGQEHGLRLPAWTFQGSLNPRTFAPGDPLRASGTVRVESPALQGVDGLRVGITLMLERLSDTDGFEIPPPQHPHVHLRHPRRAADRTTTSVVGCRLKPRPKPPAGQNDPHPG